MRIVRERTISRTTLVSLVLATLAALSFLAGWRLLRTEEPVRPVQRKLTEVELEWKCPLGHTFRAAGQVGPRRCWECNREAYPITQYSCPVHGLFETAVQFTGDKEGQPVVSSLRLQGPGHSWVPAEQGLPCPRCNRRLAYSGGDPLEGWRRGQKKPGG